jgi:hypothetical protein
MKTNTHNSKSAFSMNKGIPKWKGKTQMKELEEYLTEQRVY